MHKVLHPEVISLKNRVSELEQQVLALTKRLDELDEANKEAIEQAIAYAMYENGLTHL